MSSRPVYLDPSLAVGPTSPVSTVRPVVSEQRVLLLDGERPEMVDLAAGEIRPWENGPPITIPCESTPFSLADFTQVQVQLFRDLRSASTDQCLFTLVAGDAVITVSESVGGQLMIAGPRNSAERPIGSSPAIVVTMRPTPQEHGLRVEFSARNAETQEPCTITETLAVDAMATLTIGGPSAELTGRSGRKRPSSVHVHAERRMDAATTVKRVAGRARREASSIMQRRR